MVPCTLWFQRSPKKQVIIRSICRLFGTKGKGKGTVWPLMELFHDTVTECHLTYGITQCYLPPDTSERAPPNPSHAGRYSIYLPRKDGRLSWPSWLDSTPAGVCEILICSRPTFVLVTCIGCYLMLVPAIRLSTVGRLSFPVTGACIWNDLSSHITSSPSLLTFKQG